MSLMHKIFAVMCVLMLFATIWMFWADHSREWKVFQSEARDIELQMNQWRQLQYETDEVFTRQSQLKQREIEVQSEPIDQAKYDEFKALVAQDAVAREVEAEDLQSLDETVEAQQQLGAKAASLRAVVTQVANQVQNAITQRDNIPSEIAQLKTEAAKARKTGETEVKDWSELLPVAEEALKQAKADGEGVEEAQGEVDFVNEELAKAKALLAAADAKDAKITSLQAEVESGPIDQAKLGEELFKKAKAEDPETLDGYVDLASLRVAAISASQEAAKERVEVLAALDDIIARARFREDRALTARKFKSAELDAQKGSLGLLVRDEASEEELAESQAAVNKLKADLDELSTEYDRASAYRRALADIVAEMRKAAAKVQKDLADSEGDLERLKVAYHQQESTYFMTTSWGVPYWPGKKMLEGPIFDAFNSPLKIDNLWNDDLTIDYNFRKVRRFDRCTTCHQMMLKTMPGSAVDPAYPEGELVTFVLSTPPLGEELPELPEDRKGKNEAELQVQAIYGLQLAEPGEELLNGDAVTISFVAPDSRGAQAFKAPSEGKLAGLTGQEIAILSGTPWVEQADDHVANGLLVGDVVVQVGDDFVRTREEALRFLTNPIALSDERGKQLRVTVRRGLPHPFASHPRLDLFVGSLSPHPMTIYGCTSCHEGQGSATAFKYASHAPNTTKQAREWSREHGWFDNHHWIYPMYPERFMESTCLKCHHDVTELEASEDFPQAPAPRVVQGHDVIRKYGCFGCHEINGYDSGSRIGPDMRLEPNVFAAAQQLAASPNFTALTDNEQQKVTHLITHPEDDAARRSIYRMLDHDFKLRTDDEAKEEPRLSPADTDLSSVFKDTETVGTLRRVGPSLRYVRDKVDATFLYDWIRQPSNFRPTTRMPQFFGLWKHLPEEELPKTESYEQIEILGAVAYLLDRSQQFEPLEPPSLAEDSRTDEARLENGKWLFQSRGCLACHSHEAFPGTEVFAAPGTIQQGPDLSQLGEKFTARGSELPTDASAAERTAHGRRWMYSWIKEPTRYHVRTVMPDLFLKPYEDKEGVTIDPVSDIVDFLMHQEHGASYDPAIPPASFGQEGQLTSLTDAAATTLDELTIKNLEDAYAGYLAAEFAQDGIPADSKQAQGIKGAEAELIVGADDDPSPAAAQQRKLLYIGRKTIGKYGCYACHDIPGFEGAKPIGTALADWGRKNTSQIAFEHIAQYIEHGHGHAGHDHAEDAHAEDHSGDDHAAADHAGVDEAGHPAAMGPVEDPLPDFYEDGLLSGHRMGFLYQKLREPRSYDYHKTENKKYNERLRMPQFPFTHEQREAVVTFVLGLVADPPTESFIYSPDPRKKAILEGEQVLEKYNCKGCHIVEDERWRITFAPGAFPERTVAETYPFLAPHLEPDVLEASGQPDRRGMLHSELHGLPSLDEDTAYPEVYDSVGDKLATREGSTETYAPYSLQYRMSLFEPAAIEGNVAIASTAMTIPDRMIEDRYAANGGLLARYLAPYVRARVANVKGSQAWERLPPPLMGEGHKVQTDWLHDFLLQPYAIRPLTVLRMPKFNMTSEEASKLVDYFAAKDRADYPYAYSERRETGHLESESAAYAAKLKELGEEAEPGARLDAGLKIVTNVCVQCHIVGDFTPPDAKGPNLADVYKRLRPTYVRDWVADPARILPYTSMPVNIPYDKGVKQEFFHGTPTEQLEGLTDILMNFDYYTNSQVKITPLVPKKLPESPPAGGAAPTDTEADPASEPTEEPSDDAEAEQPKNNEPTEASESPAAAPE